jgi:hypothetical protein
MKARNIIFRARELKTGKLIVGYYVVLHLPEYDKDNPDKKVGYTKKHCIYNDTDNRSNGSYWHDIDIDTLEMIEQTELF